MGYTIYINLPKNEVKKKTDSNVHRWKATCELIKLAWKKIPEHYTDDADENYRFIGLGNGIGKCTPEITDSYICFNGKYPDDCETFYFNAFEPLEGLNTFCKTERNGYTMAVMIAILCIKKFYNNALTYSSDGADRIVWKKAQDIVERI